MTVFRLFLRFSLLAVLLTACAPATSTVLPTQSAPSQPVVTFPAPSATLDTSTQATSAPTETSAPTVLPIATSRGPKLEASDPATVKLASGGLQLVEFFEFW